MKRLTDKRMRGEGFIPVDPKEYKAFIRNEKPSGKQIYQRLLEIEDILGDDYDLDRLRKLMEACKGLEPSEIAESKLLIATRKDPEKMARMAELVEADRDGRCVVYAPSGRQNLEEKKEIKLYKRVKYAGDVHTELMKAGFTPKGAAELLGHVPDAEVAPVVNGKWLETPWGYKGGKSYECSCCYSDPFWNKHHITEKYPKCPNCGAKMNGGRDAST